MIEAGVASEMNKIVPILKLVEQKKRKNKPTPLTPQDKSCENVEQRTNYPKSREGFTGKTHLRLDV